jgi:hypothetical protein
MDSGELAREGIVFVGRGAAILESLSDYCMPVSKKCLVLLTPRCLLANAVTRLSNIGAHYGKLRIDSKTAKRLLVSIGDTVYLKSGKGQPYVAQVKDMWSDKNNERWIKGSWYFRHSDIQQNNKNLIPSDSTKDEIFMSTLQETNRAQCIISHCHIIHGGDRVSLLDVATPALYCRFMYNPKNIQEPFRALNAEDLPPLRIQVWNVSLC